MFNLDSNARYYMCSHYVDMRCGINALFNMVMAETSMSPVGGDVFVFMSKNRQAVKILRWDGDGFLLYYKRLESGSFEFPVQKGDRGCATLPWSSFSLMMEGVSLKSVRFRRRWRAPSEDGRPEGSK